jgi:hypothetical protein
MTDFQIVYQGPKVRPAREGLYVALVLSLFVIPLAAIMGAMLFGGVSR